MEDQILVKVSFGNHSTDLLIPISTNGNTIHLLKCYISDTLNVIPDRIDLFHNGTILQDESAIGSSLCTDFVCVQIKDLVIGTFFTAAVKCSYLPDITLKLAENTTVGEALTCIESLFVKRKRFSFLFDGSVLSESTVLSSLNLDGQQLVMIPEIVSIGSGSLRLIVRPMDDSSQSIYVQPDLTVSDMKKKIAHLYPTYSESSMGVIFNGRPLSDASCRLSAVEGLVDGSEIKIVKQAFQLPSYAQPSLAIVQRTVPVSTTIQIPTIQTQAGQIPTAQIPAAQIPTVQVPAGQIPTTQIPANQPAAQGIPRILPSGMMFGSVSIDIQPGNMIDPSNMTAIVTNLARTISDTLIPQMQQAATMQQSSTTDLSQESLMRIEIDLIHSEYKELLRMLNLDETVESDSNPYVVLQRTLQHMSSNSHINERLLRFVECCLQNIDYSFGNEGISNLKDQIAKYLKIFQSLIKLIRGFRYENGSVHISPSEQFHPETNIFGNPNLVSIRNGVNTSLNLTGLFKRFLQSLILGDAGRNNRNLTLKRILHLPLHPILDSFLDSFTLQEITAALDTDAEGRFRFLMGSLSHLLELFNSCILRGRPYSVELIEKESDSLWFFIHTFIVTTNSDVLKPIFDDFFSKFCKLLFESSSDPHSIQVKQSYSRHLYELLLELGQNLRQSFTENCEVLVQILHNLSLNSSWSSLLWNLFGCLVVDAYAATTYSSTAEDYATEDSEAKRVRLRSLEMVNQNITSENDRLQLDAFINADKCGYFDLILK